MRQKNKKYRDSYRYVLLLVRGLLYSFFLPDIFRQKITFYKIQGKKLKERDNSASKKITADYAKHTLYPPFLYYACVGGLQEKKWLLLCAQLEACPH